MKRIIKSILVFISYFIYDILVKILLYSLNINFFAFDTKYKVLTTFLIELSYIIIIIFIYRKEIFKDLKDFKDNYKKYLSKNVIIYLCGILLMALTNFIIYKITNQKLSGNEEAIRSYIKEFPLYMIFSSIIYAPFVEEIIFRKTIKDVIKNKYLFIIIAGLIFGLIHISNYRDINEIMHSISYIIMGINFAYIYYRTNNIFTTMTFHFCHNLVLLIIQFL